MPNYKITIEITHAVQEGDKINIDMPIGIKRFWFEFFSANSVDANQTPVEIGNTTTSTIYNLYTAFQANYNQGGLYAASWYNETMIIEGAFTNEPVLGSILPVGTNFTVELLADTLLIVSAVPQKNLTDTCSYIDVLVTGNHEFIKLYSPFLEEFPETLTYLVQNVLRGIGDTFVIGIEDANGMTARQAYPTISFLNEGVIDLQTLNNSVIITNYANSLILQYSLNSTDWQYENIFNDLQEGDYSLYIKDQFDCQIVMQFTIIVSEDGNSVIPEPYFFISNANSLRFAKRQEWLDCGVQKNSVNTLSCESIDRVAHPQHHFYLDCDVITLQVKNNYADLKIKTSDDGLTQSLVQKSNNIGIKISMDCKITALGNNEYGVYFIAGNTYDYDTGVNLNEPYVLNGELPQFGKVGNIITINSANYTISEVNYNEDLKVEQLVIASTAEIDSQIATVKAIYNIYGYEIYEVSIACTGREKFNVQIFYGNDDIVPKYSSENVNIVENNDHLILMSWYMNYNTDMFYATGIIPSVRIWVDTIKAALKNESESYETDSDSILIDSDNYEMDVFKFEPQTKETAKALVLWLSSQELTIRDIGYRKEGIEMEPLEDSNLYVVTATMVLRGSGTYEDRIGTSNVELIELIKTDADAFIKIR